MIRFSHFIFIIILFAQRVQLLFQVNVLVAVSGKQKLHHLPRWNTRALRYQFLNALLKEGARLDILCHIFFLIVKLPAYKAGLPGA
jgi:hypothetical protein